MITPADMLFWTNMTVSSSDCAVLSAAADERLNADGGFAISGVPRTQLLCYLSAAMISARNAGSRKHSESIGSYSYVAESTVASNGWYDVYAELLRPLLADAAAPSSDNGGITEHSCDSSFIFLNREYNP